MMVFADVTLAIFAVVNSLRFLAYVPQIARTIRDRSGAEAISFGTWSQFFFSHSAGMAYAIENRGGWTMAGLFLGNALGPGAVLAIAIWERSRGKTLRLKNSCN